MADPASAGDDRWLLPDLESTLRWCRWRTGQGIRCTVALATEYARTPAESARNIVRQTDGIRALGAGAPGTSFSLKPSSAGILADPQAFSENLAAIARAARESTVPLEIDMEGTPLVDQTLRAALTLTGEPVPVTIALQAYLDRTPRDLAACLQAGLRVRLVKGAYAGDTADFAAVQERFRALATILVAARVPFSAGTHDPELIAWLVSGLAASRELAEFSFLKGLADRTKIDLASRGWKVAEYVPYGPGGGAYRERRQRYLKMLERLGRLPAP